MADIKLLLPVVQVKAKELLDKCSKAGITIIYTSTYRTNEEQDALYAQGRTTPGNVITNARGGDSMHNYKVALDFVPTINGVASWNDKSLFTKVGQLAKSCGFEWGGDWVSFLDMPHIQYTLGHSLEEFKTGKVDLSKFDVVSNTYTKMMFAIRDFQLENGVNDFANVVDPTKIRLGPKTLALINAKYNP